MSELLTLLTTYETKKTKDLLKNISKDYNLNYEELLGKYLNNNVCKACNNNNKIQEHEQCSAKKQDGLRCTRRHKQGTRFCGKHENNLKFGEYTQTENNDSEQTIRVIKITIDCKNYLMDNNNIVYTDNQEKPEVIGKCRKIIKNDEVIYELL